MGLRLSCIHRGHSISPQVDHQTSPAPARVIAADGSLKDLPASPRVTVADVLGLAATGDTTSFVCSADALYFNEHPPALAAGDILLPGQMYFVLPADLLGRPLSAVDMAALAARASSALASSGKPQRRGRRRGAKRKKKVLRVMPVHEQDAEGVGLFNEKLNELTLGQVGVLLSPVRKMKDEMITAAERSRLKRALSIIREDAE